MGLSMRSQVLVVDGKESIEGNKKWVVAGILVRTPLKAINTNKKIEDGDDEEEQGCLATTPTSVDARISSERLLCPPAPRKPRPSLKFHSNKKAMDFFNPPELESIFVSHF